MALENNKQSYNIDKSCISFLYADQHPCVNQVFEYYIASSLSVDNDLLDTDEAYKNRHDAAAAFVEGTDATTKYMVSEMIDDFVNQNYLNFEAFKFYDKMKLSSECKDKHSRGQYAFVLEFTNFCVAVSEICKGFEPSKLKQHGAVANYCPPPEAFQRFYSVQDQQEAIRTSFKKLSNGL